MAFKPISIFIVSILLLTWTNSLQFHEKKNFTTLQLTNINNIEYSQNQKFIFVGNQTLSFTVLDGITYQNPQTFTLPTQDSPNSLAFSSDNNMLVVGDRNGGLYFYDRQGSSFNPTPTDVQTNTTLGVKALAFSFDNSYLAAGLDSGNNNMLIYNGKTKSFLRVLNFSNVTVNAIAWSPSSTNLAVVGGLLGNPRFKVFDANDGQILHQELLLGNKTLGVTYNKDGSKLLVNSDNIIYIYNTADWTKKNVTVDLTSFLYEMKLTKNDQYLTISGNSRLYVYKYDSTGDNYLPSQDFASVKDNHALGNYVGQLAIITQARLVTIYNLCPQDTQFYDMTSNICQDCTTSCETCIQSSSNCYSCFDKYYLNNHQCSACIPGCSYCLNGNQCQSCDIVEHFQINQTDKSCICESEYFYELKKCKPCMVGCQNCTELNICKKCNIAGHFELKENVCQCQIKYRLQNNVCLACGTGCKECSQTQCLLCDLQQHWIAVPDQYNCQCDASEHFAEKTPGLCSCEDSYYPSQNDTCEQCPLICSLCNTENNCTACRPPGITPLDGKCQCPSRTYFDNLTLDCQNCITGCLSCQEADTCSICDTEGHFILDPDTKTCKCASGFRDQDGVCVACGNGCKQCTSTQCILCDFSQHWIAVVGQYNCQCDSSEHYAEKTPGLCSCEDSYYPSQNDTCEQCPSICSLCSRPSNCSACSLASLTPVDGVCKCPKGTFFDQQRTLCTNCAQTMPFCSSCNSADVCDQCDASVHRELFENTCVCEHNYFQDDSKICIQCTIYGCLDCESLTKCRKCNYVEHWIPDKIGLGCECATFYFEKENKCQSCSAGCLRCVNENNCSQCDVKEHWKYKQYQCECQTGYFQDLNSKTCSLCSNGCQKCLEETVCLSCYQQNHYVLSNNSCVCQQGFYEFSHTECAKCEMPGCLDCLNPTICLKCKAQFYRINYTCQCQTGQFIDVDTCSLCSNGCKDCQNQNICTMCYQQNHYVLSNDKCICEQGFYIFSHTQCAKCEMPGCLKCSSPTNCQKCKSQFQFNNYTCQCGTGKFIDVDTCSLCSNGCKDCQNQNICTMCYQENHYVLSNDTCQCKKGYYVLSHEQCALCLMPGCLQCSSPTKCTKCRSSFQQQNNQCVCQAGKFININSCDQCKQPCVNCKSLDICQSCVDGYQLKQGGICQSKGLSTLVIVLIAVGSVAVVGIIIGVGVIIFLKKKSAAAAAETILTEQGGYQQVD